MTLNCKGTLVDLTSPKVMGILNITPDSFYDGGKYKSDATILNQVEKMLFEGATFIDVGAYSSKPGAEFVSEDDEAKRLFPILELILKTYPKTIMSIDTFRSKIAQTSIEIGAAIINDISAGNFDDQMFEIIAKYNVPYIAMHMQGTPKTMQKNPTYENVTKELITFFSEKIYKLHQLNVNDIAIDVGFGFGKTIEHNFELLANLSLFKSLEKPILVGISRKSMLYKTLQTTPENALNATTSANTIALLNGATILRVHDVKEAIECIKIVNQLKANH